MSGINRHVILALVGWLILAGSNPVHQPDKNTQASNKAEAPSEKPFVPYPMRDADACYNAAEHDQADLCAQWRAAIASEKAVREASRATDWAIIATLLSAIGVGGLIYTLWQTHGALNEARRGNRIAMKANARATRQAVAAAEDTRLALQAAERNADAAELAVTETAAMGRAQVRAYIAILPPTITIDDDGNIIVHARWANAGASPARQIVVTLAAYLDISPKVVSFQSVQAFPHDTAPSQEVSWPFGRNSWKIDSDLLRIVTTENRHIFRVQGDLRYQDVFGERQSEPIGYFCAQKIPVGEAVECPRIPFFGNG